MKKYLTILFAGIFLNGCASLEPRTMAEVSYDSSSVYAQSSIEIIKISESKKKDGEKTANIKYQFDASQYEEHPYNLNKFYYVLHLLNNNPLNVSRYADYSITFASDSYTLHIKFEENVGLFDAINYLHVAMGNEKDELLTLKNSVSPQDWIFLNQLETDSFTYEFISDDEHMFFEVNITPFLEEQSQLGKMITFN